MTETNRASELTRRQILQAGGISTLLGVPGLVAARESVAPTQKKPKSCIFLLLCGGPSHLDSWDLKPDAPNEIRGPYNPIATKVPGMQLSELHTRLAKLTDRLTLIHSMTHPSRISNHFDAMHNLLSGQLSGKPDDSPYLGSVLAKIRPSERNVVSYAWLIKCVGNPVFCAPNISTGGNLGAVYAPVFVGSANNHPAMENFKPPKIYDVAAPDRIPDRRKLLTALDPTSKANDPSEKEWHDLRRKAFEMTTGPAGRQAFELHREPDEVRDRYGRHPLGQNLLLARRLVEAGIGFVTVNGWTGTAPGRGGGPPSSSWDMHGGHMGMGNAFGNGSYSMGWCLPRLDEALSALLSDLDQRGMLEDTLIMVSGEFGRTPTVELPTPGANQGKKNGRDHNPQGFTMWMAGGGVKGGFHYGATDEYGYYAVENKVHMHDLHATLLHILGLDHTKLTYRYAGRDFRLTDVYGDVVHDVLASKSESA